ncbi:hypothetical protein Q1695_000269 [Nippostrongylus brasiliensis]|nr:hypothetical protein Q1695_000269 [Nippostrongylus brasiliensis]
MPTSGKSRALLAFADSLHWSVKNKDTNKTCIILDNDAVDITVKFTNVENGTIDTYKVSVNNTQSVMGECAYTYKNQSAQMMKVSFFPEGSNTSARFAQPWDLVFVFGSEEKKSAFQLIDYWLVTAPAAGMNSSIEQFNMTATHIDLQGHETDAFKCSATDLSLSNDSVIEMKNMRVIAFAQLDSDEFSPQQVYEQCLLDSRTSDIVPIVVGACLAGLVVVVLVAYLVGRARAKRQGYASV